MKLLPGQVWRTDLDPPSERGERGAARPVVIVSTPFHLRLNAYELAIVVPLTTKRRPGWQHRVLVTSGIVQCWAMTEQPRTLATSRFREDSPWWSLTTEELADLMQAMTRMITR